MVCPDTFIYLPLFYRNDAGTWQTKPKRRQTMNTDNTEVPRANWIPVIDNDIPRNDVPKIQDESVFVAPSDRGQSITIIRYHEDKPNETIPLFPTEAAELTKTIIDLIGEQ
jgi:hypothetical protein